MQFALEFDLATDFGLRNERHDRVVHGAADQLNLAPLNQLSIGRQDFVIAQGSQLLDQRTSKIQANTDIGVPPQDVGQRGIGLIHHASDNFLIPSGWLVDMKKINPAHGGVESRGRRARRIFGWGVPKRTTGAWLAKLSVPTLWDTGRFPWLGRVPPETLRDRMC